MPSDQRPEGLSLPAAFKVSKSCAELREAKVPVAANADGCAAKQAAKISSAIAVWTRREENERYSLVARQEASWLGAVESDSADFVFENAIFLFLFPIVFTKEKVCCPPNASPSIYFSQRLQKGAIRREERIP